MNGISRSLIIVYLQLLLVKFTGLIAIHDLNKGLIFMLKEVQGNLLAYSRTTRTICETGR